MRNLIDLSKLPPPRLVEELNYEAILAEMRGKLRELLPEWTGHELESDPANKVLEVAAYRELLLRQRVNEAARGVMVAFAAGGDLDHLAAFYPETRLPGALATFAAELKLSAELSVSVTVPADYRIVAKNGSVEARLMEPVAISAGAASGEGRFEIVKPAGVEANGLNFTAGWDAITPLPFVVKIEQTEASRGGSDPESDDDFRRRIPMALERYSTAGPRGAYEYWALRADERIEDVSVTSPEPGVVRVHLLSREGDGTADDAMIRRVEAVLSDETVRPLTDCVEVFPAEIVSYGIRLTIALYPGVAGTEPYMEAQRRIREAVSALRGVGRDVTRSALIAAAHVEGVKTVELLSPETDVTVSESQAAWCEGITIGSRTADEP
jgi:phage-related baseplate assembly protein